ncbi:alpha/beta fold hydrolase [Streptomyces sp. NPDC001920]
MQENKTKNEYLTGRERIVRTDGLQLWAEDFGDAGHPTALLVMGAQAQGVQWNDGLVRRLVEGGLRVIRYDHRDTGRSSRVDFAARPYTVADMASDALAVLDAFEVDRAHLVGASLGGVIAQRLAVTHPHRVLTLTSLSSQPLGTDTASAVQRALAGAPPLPGELCGRGDRGQLCRVVPAGGPGEHAEATAAAVPGARLVLIEGMGHALPAALDDRLAGEILHHTASAARDEREE